MKQHPSTALPVAPALALAAAALLPCVACESTSTMPPPATGNIVLLDGNNFSATGMLTIPGVETAPMANLDVCWGDLLKDLQCHDVDPLNQIDNVAVIRFRLSEEDVQHTLSTSMVVMAQTTGYLEHRTGNTSTCAKLFDFNFLGTPVDVKSMYTEPASANESYMMVFTRGIQTGVGARSMLFLRPTAASTNTMVAAPTGCGMLEFTANLSSLQKVSVPAAGPWVADWSGLTKDGQGNPVVFQNIDGLLVAFYAGKTVADLEAQIFDIETIATSLWEYKLPGGRTADLAMAKERTTGAPFSGFQTSTAGTWMLALTCSKCQNPAPIVLTILQPGAGAM